MEIRKQSSRVAPYLLRRQALSFSFSRCHPLIRLDGSPTKCESALLWVQPIAFVLASSACTTSSLFFFPLNFLFPFTVTHSSFYRTALPTILSLFNFLPITPWPQAFKMSTHKCIQLHQLYKRWLSNS